MQQYCAAMNIIGVGSSGDSKESLLNGPYYTLPKL